MRKMSAKLLTKSKFFVKRNASTILTCVGTVGVVATAILTANASPKALKAVENAKEEKGEDLTIPEVIKASAPSYIPVVLTGTATIACIFGANILNKRQQASLVSAYALLDNSYKTYKKKVIDLYGEDSDIRVKTEMAKDNYDADETNLNNDEKRLFYDMYSNRYFRATNETVLRAEYELNKLLSQDGAVYLNDLYTLLGIPKVDYGDYIGWSAAQMYEMYSDSWIHFTHEFAKLDDDLECVILQVTDPMPDFDEY